MPFWQLLVPDLPIPHPRWPCQQFTAEGKKVFGLVWDNASWHVGKRVQRRIGGQNRKVKRPHGDSNSG
jgi:hypothetical protein